MCRRTRAQLLNIHVHSSFLDGVPVLTRPVSRTGFSPAFTGGPRHSLLPFCEHCGEGAEDRGTAESVWSGIEG
jgi:hypothetical protein